MTDWEVIEYERGDERFHPPHFKSHVSHVLLFLMGILTAGSQIGITLGILPGSFWPITVGSFIAGFAAYIWTYFGMEHR